MPGFQLELEATPVAIAAMAVAGIVAVSYAGIEAEARMLAIGALGQLAGAAGGMAYPRLRSRPPAPAPDWGHAPASNPPEWTEGG